MCSSFGAFGYSGQWIWRFRSAHATAGISRPDGSSCLAFFCCSSPFLLALSCLFWTWEGRPRTRQSYSWDMLHFSCSSFGSRSTWLRHTPGFGRSRSPAGIFCCAEFPMNSWRRRRTWSLSNPNEKNDPAATRTAKTKCNLDHVEKGQGKTSRIDHRKGHRNLQGTLPCAYPRQQALRAERSCWAPRLSSMRWQNLWRPRLAQIQHHGIEYTGALNGRATNRGRGRYPNPVPLGEVIGGTGFPSCRSD